MVSIFLKLHQNKNLEFFGLLPKLFGNNSKNIRQVLQMENLNNVLNRYLWTVLWTTL